MKLRSIFAAIALSGGGAAAADPIAWFPAAPGVGETQYLVYMDFCGDSPPLGRPVLSLLDAAQGAWELRFSHRTDLLCFATPPGGSARAYAFEMPARIDDVSVQRVRVVERFFGTDEVVTTLERPTAVATPPSIAGTWQSAQAREQGLLITFDEQYRVVVSLNTYDASGAKAWYSGVAYAGNDRVVLPLTDTGSGTFMGARANDDAVAAWGTITIDWIACGRLQLQWQPLAATGLAAGAAEFSQLTGSGASPCHLAAYAAGRNGQPEYVAYDIVR